MARSSPDTGIIGIQYDLYSSDSNRTDCCPGLQSLRFDTRLKGRHSGRNTRHHRGILARRRGILEQNRISDHGCSHYPERIHEPGRYAVLIPFILKTLITNETAIPSGELIP